MALSKLSENYYLRNYYLNTEQVPTQTVMKEKMSTSLANVYFKSMTPKLKVLAGLEPPMKGGGSDWFVPPEDLLKGRTVMKPIKNQYIKKLGFNGIDDFGDKLVRHHQREMEEEKCRLLQESDSNWKATVEASYRMQWDDTSKELAKQNTAKIQQAFNEFSIIYAKSINNIENLLLDAAIKEIKRVEEEAYNKMSGQFAELLKQQATMLYDRYAVRLQKEKTRQKKTFITAVENARTKLGHKLHDINVEKMVAVQRLRALLECQNLACQVYVDIKEKEECKKDIERSKHEHKKAVKILSEQIQMQDFEIRLAKEKEVKRQEFIKIWQKKVCCVVKKFQEFVKYCLSTLPEHADFFINMEKLMLLQISEAMEDPRAESIFVPEEPTLYTPVPKPHPFYLFCDKGFNPRIDQDLCPKHCTSSASQLPVIVVNKRYIYAACDNMQNFTEKVKQFLNGQRGNDVDFIDDHDYTFDIPVRCSSSDQLLELKLESSLMQVLQNELSIIENVNLKSFLRQTRSKKSTTKNMSPIPTQKPIDAIPMTSNDYGKEIKTRDEELEHLREPKWDSYLNYVIPKRCKCAKKAKKHLEEHLPFYMRNMSPFDELNLPHYKICTIDKLKKLVKNAQRRPSPPPTPVKIEPKTREMGTQYSDQEFDFMCTCFSNEEIAKIFQTSKLLGQEEIQFKVVDGSLFSMDLLKDNRSFADDRAHSLRRLIEVAPEIEELFKKKDCNF